jgi:phage baseplate assembly protein W
MATNKILSREDGNLQTSILTARSRKYVDIDLSFEPKANGDIYKKQDAAAVKQAIKNLILTNHLEKPFQPLYGGNITSYFFELAYDETADEIRDDIISAIETYEPRAKVIDVIVDVKPDYNSIAVTIEFKVINTEELVTFTTTVLRLR